MFQNYSKFLLGILHHIYDLQLDLSHFPVVVVMGLGGALADVSSNLSFMEMRSEILKSEDVFSKKVHY